MVKKYEVDKFVKAWYCKYYPYDISKLRTRAVLSIFENLPSQACFAIMSLRYNGEYDREAIMKTIREQYGFPIREIAGEYTYTYGIFPEHFVVVFNKQEKDLIPIDKFREMVTRIGREIIKGKAILADTGTNTFEHIAPEGQSTTVNVKNVTRKNAIQWQFGDNFKLTLSYDWMKTWTKYPRALGLNILGRLWSEDDYSTTDY